MTDEIYHIDEPGVASPEEIRQYLARQNASLALVREGKEPEDYKGFRIVPADTYALGVAEMRKIGDVPTFEQNLDARIADHELGDDESGLFDTWLDSITGIATKAHSTKFKIIPRASQLENVEPDFRQSSIRVDYDSLEGVELDSSDPAVKYNQLLTEVEVKEHPAWIAAAGGDKDKLKRYAHIWFERSGRPTGMGFYVRSDTAQDELRALVLDYVLSNSVAGGNYILSIGARFASGK